jgi:predicted metalloprotease with PDZ domain
MSLIHYTLNPIDPAGHIFEVLLRISNPAANGQIVRLPAWIPGSYKLREFAKNITAIIAQSAGQSLTLTQLDKHTWQTAPCTGELIVNCRIYAYELSVRTAYLDERQAFINFSSLCLAVVGQEHLPCTVELLSPAHAEDWQVITSLPRLATPQMPNSYASTPSLGNFYAPNYDALIDYPVQLAPTNYIAQGSFTAHGAPHTIAIVGRVASLDMARLEQDSAAICAAHIALFEPITRTAPFLDSSTHYSFITQAVGEGYGGLEHRASSALICQRTHLPNLLDPTDTLSAGYQQYLGLVSHEYFHTWNIKRIKPALFAPYELSQEAYTPLLWLFEGFTAYYDDLILARAGIITPQHYLDTLASTASGVLRSAGRLQQSVASASFNAWVKYYLPDENSPNALCSYYTQGSLIAAYLDLYIRLETAHSRSLDDVMRMLWVKFGRDFYRAHNTEDQGHGLGVTLSDIYAVFKLATGLNLKPLIEKLTQSAADIPLAPLFAQFGVSWTQEAANATRDSASLGAITRTVNTNDVIIATAYTGEAAHRAGLSGGDVLVALAGLRITPSSLPTILARLPVGTRVRALAWRRDELIDTVITLDAAPKTQVKLSAKQFTPALRQWLVGT